MVVGAGVSGSGCGTEYLKTVSAFQTTSLISFALALLVGVIPSPKKNTSDKPSS